MVLQQKSRTGSTFAAIQCEGIQQSDELANQIHVNPSYWPSKPSNKWTYY